MFVLAIGLVLVGRPIDALLSVGVVMTNVIVGVVQEIRAKRTLDRISLLTRPWPTSCATTRSAWSRPRISSLATWSRSAPGDQFVLDGKLATGRLQADESLLTGESDLSAKQPGDQVFSGSFA